MRCIIRCFSVLSALLWVSPIAHSAPIRFTPFRPMLPPAMMPGMLRPPLAFNTGMGNLFLANRLMNLQAVAVNRAIVGSAIQQQAAANLYTLGQASMLPYTAMSPSMVVYQNHYYPSTMYGGGNGGGSYASQPSSASVLTSSPYLVSPQAYTGGANSAVFLDALAGLSTGGQLNWPVGLRTLPPSAETDNLRQRIDGLVQSAVAEAEAGGPDKQTVKAAVQDVDQLRGLFRANSSRILAQATRDEAASFLTKLDKALKQAQ